MQRYVCLTCHRSFIRQKTQTVGFKDFRSFYQFILGNKNRLQIASDANISRKTLSVAFLTFFTKPLTPVEVMRVFPLTRKKDWVLALDGTWLRRFGVIMIYWNYTTNEGIWWSWESSESYLAIAMGLSGVVEQMKVDYLPSGVVSDWKGSIVAGVERYIGVIPHQRCLAHVKREIERLLPRHSPYQATLELRRVGLALLQVKTFEQKEAWILFLNSWHTLYSSVLTERSIPELPTKTRHKWWYTHSNVRRAYRTLTKDQEHLFKHLDHPLLPSTNNTPEGINSDIKTKLRNHRGMKADQQYQFVSWYLTFKKIKKPTDLKRLWDMWKRCQ